MKYAKKGEKFVFEKDGIYFGLTLDQVSEMKKLCEEILGCGEKANASDFDSDNSGSSPDTLAKF